MISLILMYFSLAVMCGGILGLSLANAVFVDQMTADNNETVEQKLDVVMAQLEALRAELASRSAKGPDPV